MMGTLVQVQLYTLSYRKALFWPQKLPNNEILSHIFLTDKIYSEQKRRLEKIKLSILSQLWDNFKTTLGRHWDHSETTLRQLFDHIETTLWLLAKCTSALCVAYGHFSNRTEIETNEQVSLTYTTIKSQSPFLELCSLAFQLLGRTPYFPSL